MTKQNDFNKLLGLLKKSRGYRQGLVDKLLHIAVEDFNTSSNVTKFNKLLLSGDYLENNEIQLVKKYLEACTTIDKLTVGKSQNGNKTIKILVTGSIIWTNVEGLYTFQKQAIEPSIKPFDESQLIESLIRLLQKSEKSSIDFMTSLKEAKKRIQQKANKTK